MYAQQKSEVSAKLYNLWRRAKLHFPLPIRLPLKDYQRCVMVLEAHAWICVNEQQHDLPILAWVSFEDRGRDALHLPVACTLNHYHYAASKISEHTLELMAEALEEKLHKG